MVPDEAHVNLAALGWITDERRIMKTAKRNRIRNRFNATIEALEGRQLLSTLITGSQDYAPNTLVQFSGSGFHANEKVDIRIVSTTSSPVDVLAITSSSGDFTANWNIGSNNVGASLTATATDSVGDIGVAHFTDSNDYTICTSDGTTENTNFLFPAATDVYVKATRNSNLAAGYYFVKVIGGPGNGNDPVLGTSDGATLHVATNGVLDPTQLWSLVKKTSDSSQQGFDLSGDKTPVYKIYLATESDFSNQLSEFEEFKLAGPDQPTTFAVSGTKFLDHTGNGLSGATDRVSGFTIDLYADSNFNHLLDDGDQRIETATTGIDGSYSFADLNPGSTYFVVDDIQATSDPSNWIQTGGGNYDYDGYLQDFYTETEAATGQDFANVHLTAHNGLTIGFFANSNGEAALTGAKTGKYVNGDIVQFLNNLENTSHPGMSVLVDSSGNYVPMSSLGTYSVLQKLLKTNATNMATMLSAQLLATDLNCYFGQLPSATGVLKTGITTTETIDVARVTLPGTSTLLSSDLLGSLQTNGVTGGVQDDYVTIQGLIDAAVTSLSADSYTVAAGPDRVFQEALKDCFDAINNGETIFVV
jgi:hypothetical protein